MESRLERRKFSRKACEAAIRGERIPDALGLPLTRFCVVRGIRYHSGFGEELRGFLPAFTRALNARCIMSNSIPDIANPEDAPYCIWHPEVATEETYRSLATRYPSMVYQVGRACAVAGYTGLYKELGILPDVHIAEEARECSSITIFNEIMSESIKYEVMNDYDRKVNLSNPQSSRLNGDTAVLWMLEKKQRFRNVHSEVEDDDTGIYALLYGEGFDDNPFNITEDMNVDLDDVDPSITERSKPDLEALLTSRLPEDLPTVEKDLLICMAAYQGDIDRYVRLRRPTMIPGELEACVRGIYHNTFFAIWWSKQDVTDIAGSSRLREAIDARFIMNNVLYRVTSDTFRTPYLIWFPSIAYEATYRKLAELRPEMLPQIVRACIVADYRGLFDDLVGKIQPDTALLAEAERAPDMYYLNSLRDRSEVAGKVEIGDHESWKLQSHTKFAQSSAMVLRTTGLPWPEHSFGSLYNGIQCDASTLELMISLPQEWRVQPEDHATSRELNYVDWPIKKL